MILRLLLCGLGLVTVGACGRSVRHEPSLNEGDAGSSATGGTGGDAATGGSSGTGAGTTGGSAPEGGSAGTSNGAGSPSTGGMGGLGSVVLCPGANYLSVQGALPDFGSDFTFGAGCASSRIAPYPTAASFTVGRGKMVYVEIDACSDDGTQEVLLDVYFTEDSSGQATLTNATFRFADANADGKPTESFVTGTVGVTETNKPVMNWIDTIDQQSAGVGAKYEGSFTVDGSNGSTPVHLTGTFSVCHVANFRNDLV